MLASQEAKASRNADRTHKISDLGVLHTISAAQEGCRVREEDEELLSSIKHAPHPKIACSHSKLDSQENQGCGRSGRCLYRVKPI